jgi:hypothetical protein
MTRIQELSLEELKKIQEAILVLLSEKNDDDDFDM